MGRWSVVFLVAVLLVTGAAAGGVAPLRAALWDGAVDLGGGWKWLDWFEYFYDGQTGWIYHREHGWMFAAGADAAGIYLWSSETGWWWTSETHYPSLYSLDRGEWLWYDRGSADPRWFYNLDRGWWEDDGLVMVTPYVNGTDMASINEAFSTSAACPWNFEHRGIDFMSNGPLRAFQAVYSGTVDHVGLWQNGQNWQVNVRIIHDAHHAAEYAFEPMSALDADGQTQLANIQVSQGESVERGQVIGYLHRVNSGSHVDLGVFTDWNPVCPEPYFTVPARASILDLIHVVWPGSAMCY